VCETGASPLESLHFLEQSTIIKGPEPATALHVVWAWSGAMTELSADNPDLRDVTLAICSQ